MLTTESTPPASEGTASLRYASPSGRSSRTRRSALALPGRRSPARRFGPHGRSHPRAPPRYRRGLRLGVGDRTGRTVPLETTASATTVDLLPALVRELRVHRARRAALGIHLVRADALPFAARTWEPHHQRSALRAVQTAAIAAKLGHVAAHDLRHGLVANVARRRADARRRVTARTARIPGRHGCRVRGRVGGEAGLAGGQARAAGFGV